MASTIVLIPSTDKTGAADTAAINTALGDAGSGTDASTIAWMIM